MSDKGVLRKELGSKRAELRGDWRQLHNEELCYVYCSPTDIRVITPRNVGQTEVHRVIFLDWRRKPEGKAALRRPRCRWDVNITIRLREME